MMMRFLYRWLPPARDMMSVIKPIAVHTPIELRPKILPIASTEFPAPSPGTSEGLIFGNGSRGALVYRCSPSTTEDHAGSYAVIRIGNGILLAVGGPNDEAHAGHPIAALMTEHAAIVEVRDSPWANELCRIGHNQGVLLERYLGRHLVFFFKENTVEIVAEAVDLAGVFPTLTSAWQEGVRVAGCSASTE